MRGKMVRMVGVTAVCASLGLAACEKAIPITPGAGGSSTATGASTTSATTSTTTTSPTSSSSTGGGFCVLDTSATLDSCTLQ